MLLAIAVVGAGAVDVDDGLDLCSAIEGGVLPAQQTVQQLRQRPRHDEEDSDQEPHQPTSNHDVTQRKTRLVADERKPLFVVIVNVYIKIAVWLGTINSGYTYGTSAAPIDSPYRLHSACGKTLQQPDTDTAHI